MPPRNERISTMVRSELAKNPSVDNAVLLEKARSIDPKVRRLSPRQFHATYRLPALRAAAPKTAASGRAASKSAASRTAESGPAARPATPPPAAPAASAPAVSDSAAPASASPAPAAPGKSLTRPHAAEREAVRSILQTVAREALGTEDRGSFVRLLDSLDERAAVILSIFGRG